MIAPGPAPGDLRPNPDWTGLPIFDRTGWKRLPFGEFASSINERVEPADAAEEIYVGLEHLDPENLHIRRWGKGSDVIGTKLRFRKGDIIFGRRRAYQRKLAVAEFDGICSAHAMVVRAKPEVVLPEFLPFLMMSDRFMNRAVEISVGSLSPTINWKTLKNEEFDLPPLEQQRRIAEVLWAVDETIHKTAAVREAAELAIESDLADFIYNGENWPRICCRELLAEGPKNGFSPKTTCNTDGQPTLSISAIRDGKVITEGNLKYADLKPDEVGQYILYPNDILVVRGNGNRLLCGRAGIVETTPTGCFYPDLLIRIRFRTDALLPKFAVLQWNERGTHTRLLSKAKSTNGIWKINRKDIQAHELAVPPISKQQRYLDSYTRASTLVDDLQNQENATANLLRVLINTVVA